jgi:hypothetical protein
MAKSEWVRKVPRIPVNCSKRDGGCGNLIGTWSQTTWGLPPGTRRKWWRFLCGKCAQKVGLLPSKPGSISPPVTFYDPDAFLPPGDR